MDNEKKKKSCTINEYISFVDEKQKYTDHIQTIKSNQQNQSMVTEEPKKESFHYPDRKSVRKIDPAK